MIAYEVALEKAKTLKRNIDNGVEYENGWLFGCHADAGFEGGGGHTPVIIQKEDGRAINMPQFIVNGTGKMLKAFDI